MSPTNDEIEAWLKRHDRDRVWLAGKLPAAKGTVDNFFSKGFSNWALTTIKLLMERDAAQTDPVNDTGLVQFTVEEFERIEKARVAACYETRPPFYHDAIIRRVAEIESEMNIIKLPVRYGDPEATKAGKVAEEGEK